MDQTTPVSSLQTPTNGVGGKIAIIIVLLIIIVGAVTYFSQRPVSTQEQTTTAQEQAILGDELENLSSIDLEADLKLIDKELE